MLELDDLSAAEDWDADDQNTDFFTVGRKIKIDLADMDYLTWLRDLQSDAETLQLLLFMVPISPRNMTASSGSCLT